VTSNGDKDMTKNLFDDVIGEVPPSTVDVDAAIARGRRADRMRRIASPTLATVAAVAVLLGGVAVVVLSDDDAGGYAPAVPPGTSKAVPSSSTAPASDSPCAGMAPTAPAQPEEPAVAEDRLSDVLPRVVSGELGPGATLQKNPISMDQDGKPLGPLEAAHWFSEVKEVPDGCQGEDYYLAAASVKSANGTGSVDFVIARAGGSGGGEEIIVCDPEVIAPERTSCRTETTPNGDKVLLTRLQASDGSVTNRVDVLRADQTFVVAESSNMATSGKYPGPPDATKVPLTQAQLKRIAVDPSVTLYPH